MSTNKWNLLRLLFPYWVFFKADPNSAMCNAKEAKKT